MKGATDLLFIKTTYYKRERALGALNGTLIRIPQCFSHTAFLKKCLLLKNSSFVKLRPSSVAEEVLSRYHLSHLFRVSPSQRAFFFSPLFPFGSLRTQISPENLPNSFFRFRFSNDVELLRPTTKGSFGGKKQPRRVGSVRKEEDGGRKTKI